MTLTSIQVNSTDSIFHLLTKNNNQQSWNQIKKKSEEGTSGDYQSISFSAQLDNCAYVVA